ncbi:MAG: MBL fold metallo-hydrolase [Clostridiaceae bacterium]|nr:MBL fold metallo-hydrolase [Clostridiaceae bacterium]
MEVLFLGTGAADWPHETAALGDSTATNRRCTSVLIDNTLLIDPGPDVPEALAAFHVDPTQITTVLISHSHGDHYAASTLEFLSSVHPIDVYGDGGYPQKLPNNTNLRFHPLTLRHLTDTPAAQIIPVLSTHVVEDTEENCLHYIIIRDGQTVFYGPDGAWFGGGTWYELEKHHFDCMILDATFGDDATKFRIPSRHIWFYHNSTSMIAAIRDACFDKKIADDRTRFVANHLARGFYPDIETAKAVFEPIGFIASYDGMRLSF